MIAEALFGSEALAKQPRPNLAMRFCSTRTATCAFCLLVPMSSSRSSSSSPEPEIAPAKSKKSKDGKKKKQQATMDVDQHGRNEGDTPDWDYKPPDGFALMKHKVDESDFDWDAIHNDDNLELWVVRVSEGVSIRAYCLCRSSLK